MNQTEKPKVFSKMKPAEKFESFLLADDFFTHGRPKKELLFHDERKWRFDFCWPDFRLAVEIDGFGYGHQAQQRLAQNNEKQNAAVEMGWRVLRFDSRTLGSKANVQDAVDQVKRVLMGQTEKE